MLKKRSRIYPYLSSDYHLQRRNEYNSIHISHLFTPQKSERRATPLSIMLVKKTSIKTFKHANQVYFRQFETEMI